jgi:hypothetical protein
VYLFLQVKLFTEDEIFTENKGIDPLVHQDGVFVNMLK